VATPAMGPAGTPATKGTRGKDQIQWSDDVWKSLDEAVTEEMVRTRVAAKFLPQVHVPKKRTTVDADVVIVPGTPGAPPVTPANPFDAALSIDESQTNRIQEYWTTFRLSVAQVEAEGKDDMQMSVPAGGQTGSQTAASSSQGQGMNTQGATAPLHRASTACSLAVRAANFLAQAEDMVLFNGQNAVVNSPVFIGQTPGQSLIQALDLKLSTDLDLGLLNIQPFPNGSPLMPLNPAAPQNVIALPALQIIPVHPVSPNPLANTLPTFPFVYRENTLNAVAQGFSVLQGLGHYENYALALHTYPYADLHQALPTTLIEPVEPVSHLVKAGIFGTGTLPPFTAVTAAGQQLPGTGLPTLIMPPATSPSGTPFETLGSANITGFLNAQGGTPNVLYTGVLVSLSGNTMDLVRGVMEDLLDVLVTFNQKDQNEKYRFRVVQRLALRLKDPSAVILLLFLDS